MMSKSGIDYINSKPELVRQWIEREKDNHQKYLADHPDSLIPAFHNDLRNLGFEFEISNQIMQFLPIHKAEILPLAVKYYQQAREKLKDNEQNYFLGFFHFKGFEEVVPMLLEDFYSPNTSRLTREFIGESLRVIRSKKFINDYLKIISSPKYGTGRLAIISLVGKLKVDAAIPLFIEMLEDEKLRSHAISALGDYKREEFRPYFKRFENDQNTYLKKYAKSALKKLDGLKNNKE